VFKGIFISLFITLSCLIMFFDLYTCIKFRLKIYRELSQHIKKRRSELKESIIQPFDVNTEALRYAYTMLSRDKVNQIDLYLKIKSYDDNFVAKLTELLFKLLPVITFIAGSTLTYTKEELTISGEIIEEIGILLLIFAGFIIVGIMHHGTKSITNNLINFHRTIIEEIRRS